MVVRCDVMDMMDVMWWIWIWELDYKESWASKNWCFWIVVGWGSLGLQKINPVHPKGNQPWIFIGRTDAEAELKYFGHLMQRTDSLEKDSMDLSLGQLLELVMDTGKTGVLQSMGSQWVGHDWATELNWYSTWDLSSPTRDRTLAPCTGSVEF